MNEPAIETVTLEFGRYFRRMVIGRYRPTAHMALTGKRWQERWVRKQGNVAFGRLRLGVESDPSTRTDYLYFWWRAAPLPEGAGTIAVSEQSDRITLPRAHG